MTFEGASIAQHLRKSRKIACRRENSRASGLDSTAWFRPGINQRLIFDKFSVRTVFVGPGEALHFGFRHIKTCVLHSEGVEQTLLEKRAKGLSRNALDHSAQYVHIHTVGVGVARLMFQRQLAELRDKIRQSRATPEIRAAPELCQFVVSGEIIDQPARVRKQMLDCDRAFKRSEE